MRILVYNGVTDEGHIMNLREAVDFLKKHKQSVDDYDVVILECKGGCPARTTPPNDTV